MTGPRCGTVPGYRAHRRDGTPVCPACRTANATYMHRYRIRLYLARGPLKVDATGTRRRLHALMRMGWPATELGARLGVTASTVRNWTRTTGKVHRSTAGRVAAVYDELWDQPGPSRRVADYAARHGWPTPLMWDDDTLDDPRARPHVGSQRVRPFDDIAVERAVRGYPTRLRPAERAEVVRRLTAAGLSAAQIAERVGRDKRSVVRMRNGAGRAAS